MTLRDGGTMVLLSGNSNSSGSYSLVPQFISKHTILLVFSISFAFISFLFEIQAAAQQLTSGSYTESPVVEDGAMLKQVTTNHGYTEGPVSDDAGNLYFVDIPFNSIFKITPDGRTTSFVRGDGCANGLAIGPDGVLYACLNGDRCVVAVDSRGNYTVVADKYQGKRLNNPNDLWIDAKGGIYFTDPTFYLRLTIEQDGRYVYYITPNRKSIIRVIDDTTMPNGIIGTNDNKTLYVADMGGGGILKYTINADGTLSNKSVHVRSGADGMTLDNEGNIYLTGRGITVYNPEGKLIETIAVPEGPSNCCFGGPDKKTLYITARTSVYSIKMKIPGM
jgi:gluconolactonase